MDVNISIILFYGSALAFVLLITLCIFIIATAKPFPEINRSKKEKYFLNPSSGEFIEFPSLNKKSNVHLSVVVPAYNEEKRLPSMLDECIAFLDERGKNSDFKYEVIVVSDGSTDKTVEVAHGYATRLGSDKIRVLALETNRGKGGAVRLGMQSARGSLLLFADADGATKFCDLSKLENSLNDLIYCNYLKEPSTAEEKLAISIGSRAHLKEEAIASRSFFRTILMYGFHTLVWIFGIREIKDTQCGFKLFTRKAARMCFDIMHVERWAFDVELLYLAQCLKIPISEIAVNWTEIDGSKVTPVWSWIQMGLDLVIIKLHYTLGAWKIKNLHE